MEFLSEHGHPASLSAVADAKMRIHAQQRRKKARQHAPGTARRPSQKSTGVKGTSSRRDVSAQPPTDEAMEQLMSHNSGWPSPVGAVKHTAVHQRSANRVSETIFGQAADRRGRRPKSFSSQTGKEPTNRASRFLEQRSTYVRPYKPQNAYQPPKGKENMSPRAEQKLAAQGLSLKSRRTLTGGVSKPSGPSGVQRRSSRRLFELGATSRKEPKKDTSKLATPAPDPAHPSVGTLQIQAATVLEDMVTPETNVPYELEAHIGHNSASSKRTSDSVPQAKNMEFEGAVEALETEVPPEMDPTMDAFWNDDQDSIVSTYTPPGKEKKTTDSGVDELDHPARTPFNDSGHTRPSPGFRRHSFFQKPAGISTGKIRVDENNADDFAVGDMETITLDEVEHIEDIATHTSDSSPAKDLATEQSSTAAVFPKSKAMTMQFTDIMRRKGKLYELPPLNSVLQLANSLPKTTYEFASSLALLTRAVADLWPENALARAVAKQQKFRTRPLRWPGDEQLRAIQIRRVTLASLPITNLIESSRGSDSAPSTFERKKLHRRTSEPISATDFSSCKLKWPGEEQEWSAHMRKAKSEIKSQPYEPAEEYFEPPPPNIKGPGAARVAELMKTARVIPPYVTALKEAARERRYKTFIVNQFVGHLSASRKGREAPAQITRSASMCQLNQRPSIEPGSAPWDAVAQEGESVEMDDDLYADWPEAKEVSRQKALAASATET